MAHPSCKGALEVMQPVILSKPLQPTSPQNLVVWAAETGGASGKKVHGQRVSADGSQVCPDDFQISQTPDGNTEPDMAYDESANRYLVVWQGTPSGMNEAFDQRIYGQLLGPDGGQVDDDFQIGAYRAAEPTIVDNSVDSAFLVAWHKDRHEAGDPSDTAVTEEIRGQLVNSSGAEFGGGDFLISTDRFHTAKQPDVAYDPVGNHYLTVFVGVTSAAPPEERIFGQELDENGGKVGTEGFQISTGSDDEEPRSVIHNPTSCEYLTAWEGSNEIFARRLAATAPCVIPPAPPPPPTLCKGKTATITGTGGVTEGTKGKDVISGTAGKDVIRSSGGKDLVCALAGTDKVRGGAGDDQAFGAGGKDRLVGQSGKDRLVGGGGKDTLVGGPGKDRLKSGPGSDKIKSGPGTDKINCGAGNDKVIVTAGSLDKISASCEKVVEKPAG